MRGRDKMASASTSEGTSSSALSSPSTSSGIKRNKSSKSKFKIQENLLEYEAKKEGGGRDGGEDVVERDLPEDQGWVLALFLLNTL